MKRVAIVGVTSSGKTTLARRLSLMLDVPHVELDSLAWKPGWTMSDPPVLRESVTAALAGDAWVVDGNYGSLRDLIWQRAEVLIWLDFPLPIVLIRLLKRTIRRIVTRENLWGSGNYETWRGQFFDRESLFLYALKSHAKHRREYPQLISQPQYNHLKLFRLRSSQDVDTWLRAVEEGEINV